MTRTLCIIPARYNSARFPGKVLKEINGKPMLRHVIERCAQSVMVDDIVVATSRENKNKPLIDWLEKHGVNYTAPDIPEGEVLNRFIAASVEHDSEYIVRVNGDSPMILPTMIDRAVVTMLRMQNNEDGYPVDYVGYKFKNTPSVLTRYAAPEVFTSQVLQVWSTIQEHVTPAAYARTISHWIDLDGKPFTTVVDTPEDLAKVTFRMRDQCNLDQST